MSGIKKISLLLATLLFVSPLWADTNAKPALNSIMLQLHAEQWVTTTTALVNIVVNASATDQGLEQIRADVLQKLGLIATAPEGWHIVSFTRQQDKSGLENIQITAQARLPQPALGNLRGKAKNISKPGVTFSVDSVEFIPSTEEIRQAKQLLRTNIYQQAKAELDAINKLYPTQTYYVHKIDFTMPPIIAPMPMMAFARTAGGNNQVAPPLSVGNKIELNAKVVLASTINVPINPINPGNKI